MSARVRPLRHRVADDAVHVLVGREDRAAPLRRPLRGVERMLGIEEAEHDVLHAVGELEVVDQHVPVVLRQGAGEDLLLLVHRLLDVVEEGLLVDRAAALGDQVSIIQPRVLNRPCSPVRSLDEARAAW